MKHTPRPIPMMLRLRMRFGGRWEKRYPARELIRPADHTGKLLLIVAILWMWVSNEQYKDELAAEQEKACPVVETVKHSGVTAQFYFDSEDDAGYGKTVVICRNPEMVHV